MAVFAPDAGAIMAGMEESLSPIKYKANASGFETYEDNTAY